MHFKLAKVVSRSRVKHLLTLVFTNAQMSINAGIAGRSCQIFIFPIGDVLVGTSVAIFLGQSKVYYVHEVASLAEAHEKVVGFYVTMNEVFRMNVLNTSNLKSELII